MSDGPTPHLEAIRGDYAPTVLLPGDPKRARFVADTYLDDVRQVNSVRNADGFTGTCEGRPVSVQAVGMGVPSAAIYYTELIRFYGCKKLIRVGSAGGLSESVKLGDIIVAVEGSPVRSQSELRLRLEQRRVGDEVELTLDREGRAETVRVRLGEPE